MTGESSTSSRDAKVFRTIREDFRQVHADVRRQGLGSTVRHTVDDLERFYISPEQRQRLAGMGRFRRGLYLSAWLLKSLFLRLTPPRRILMVLGFVFLFTSVSFQTGAGGVRINNVPALGAACLLIVLMLELKDKLLFRDELEAGRAVQRALMPVPAPPIHGWDVWLFTRSANEVGGDLVDYMPLGDGRFGIVLADVAGKGLPAALLMAKLQATWRALAPECGSLAELGTKLNQILHRDSVPGTFSTLVYLELTAGAGQVDVLNAGHMPPLVVRDGAMDELPRGGMALGLVRSASYATVRVDLSPGDLLLVYTDGVTEAMDRNGELFGDDRFRALVPGLSTRSPRDLASAIVDAIDAFAGEAPAHDDVSLLVARRTP